MKIRDPLFDEEATTATFETTASTRLGSSAPISPVSKQPMKLYTSKSGGREIKMWGDLHNRIIYPASENL